MKRIKPALLLIRASLRQNMKSKKAMFMGLLVPQAYSTVFIFQILINYKINPHAFNDLPMSYYFTALFTSQTIVFTAWERSPRELAKLVLSSDIDLILLRPVSLFYYKYFRYFDFIVPTMAGFYLILLFISFYFTGLPLIVLGYIFVVIIVGSLIKLNIRTALRGLVFFFRDVLNTTRLEESIELLTQNKPPEVFPLLIKTFLTFIIPVLLFNNGAFDIVRSFETPQFWLLLFFWLGLSITLNHFSWTEGLKRYESMG
jgi:ABC-type uncharacterized transport system permease subunit